MRIRFSTLLLIGMVVVALGFASLVYAGGEVAAGSYSCGVDNPSATQCKRTTSRSPIDCASKIIDGAVVYGCKVRPAKQAAAYTLMQPKLEQGSPEKSQQ